MENSTFTSQLDRLFSIWNNAVHCINLWVCAAGKYRLTSILGRVHTAFFNCNCFSKMANMPDENVLAKFMTALDLEFERALHYHDEGYYSDNDYGLPGPFMRHVCIYLVPTTKASLDPVDYKGAQGSTSPSTPR